MTQAYVCVRRIINDQTLLITMLKIKPDWNGIEYIPKGSKGYEGITSWCNIKKDLKPCGVPGVSVTFNGILYDETSERFVTPAHEGWIALDLSSVLPPEIACYVGFDHDHDSQFVYENVFPTDTLEELEKVGAISPRILVSPNFLRLPTVKV